MNVWYPVQIRFRDLDPLAHVNNTVYFTYFEEARGYYLDQLALEHWPSQTEDQFDPTPEEDAHTSRISTTALGAHYGMLVKDVQCTYQLPIIRTDIVEIGVRVTHVGRSSFVTEQLIRDTQEPERIFATGRAVLVWANYHTGRPHPVPPALRSAFERMEGRAFPMPEK